jgi:glucose/arabinose dehydrogenase
VRIRLVARLLLGLVIAAAVVVPAAAPASASTTPSLQVTVVQNGLDHPWDIAFAADGTMFVTERVGRLWIKPPGQAPSQLTADLSDLWVSGETGLMGLEVDPNYASNRRIYTCQGTTDNGDGVQVIAWTINAQNTIATRVSDPLVGPIDGSTGRHAGCRLRINPAGELLIGTGDAATGSYPQSITGPGALNGKTLRVDRMTGLGLSGNPYFGATPGDDRIQTIGHRNVQGLAIQPGTNKVWSIEHGTDRDDEINVIDNGVNYGWDPVGAGGTYDETQPMTDFNKFPSARGAAWTSGFPTVAPSGATFLQGTQWGSWNGMLAVCQLKASSLRIFSVNANANTATLVATPPELNNTYGRLRACDLAPDGSLFITTDNGTNDVILRVQPSGNGGPSVASSQANRVDQVVRGAGDDVLQRSRVSGTWSPFVSLGGLTNADPDIAAWPNHLDVVVRGVDGAVWQKAATSGNFAPSWTALGGFTNAGPTAVSWGTDRTDVFVRGGDGALWANAWVVDHWVGWYPLGGGLNSGPDAASPAANVLDVFAVGRDNAMWHRRWTGVYWTDWRSLGGQFTSGPGAVSIGGGHVVVTGRGSDGALWRITFDGTIWTGWSTLGGFLVGDPDAVSPSGGTAEFYVRGGDGQQWMRTLATDWTPVT